jgi:superfamily II DNA/RNA helicase
MYKRYQNNQFRGQRGARRIRSFDPSFVINNPPRAEEVREYAITHAFSDFDIEETLKRNVSEHGYITPTPIQDQCIGPLLEGRDLIGIANTGTGKTAAFLIPLINKVLKDANHRVLILAPTRELASQTRDEFVAFAKDLRIYSALLIGGAGIGRQIDSLRRYPNFVIGTPGRIKDHLRSRYLDLSKFDSVVLDEADRMVDIGFLPDMRQIIALLPQNRQSLFFSATIDGKVKEIIKGFVSDPVMISVKTGDTAQNIEQKVIRVPDPTRKIEQLYRLITEERFEKVLVFGRTKHGVQKLADELAYHGLRAEAIHGNKNQSQRMRTLDKFKRGEIEILIATDVASRGLDIPNVSHVINYDLPESYEAYIHRIGRTGRMDKKGIALTFVEG